MTALRMTSRRRIMLLLLITVAVIAAAGIYAATAFQDAQASQSARPPVNVTTSETLPSAPYVLFRNTAPGQGFGEAATVPLADPGGQRALSGKSCDRVYGSNTLSFCLQTNRGLATNFQATVYDGGWKETASWPLPGIPSRARTNADGSLLASTVFVSGHAYSGAGFSTETVIRDQSGTGTGSLEGFALILDGTRIKATDRNIWGVTFVPGQPDAFYATASSQGKIWLVQGSIAGRTLTVVRNGIECPSISPDGTRLAYKKSDTGTLTGHRSIAVLDLASGTESVLAEQQSIDDQIEWLDNSTLLYGLPRDGSEVDSDIWSIRTDPSARPALFIEHAWSPSVVR
ncbi:hypothetical protein E5206_10060 [Arthrobacter sp. PAMC25564]|uniref:hypothetical protein n=1 Tax=Arthrobacter sp. PAMC25564 TaxID=2565366 RepID=UPI0010A26A56|nr:hypothetical protein [Arthrobacter sp. PAMC25564]QCB97228.1 hypothetical protein E5206_10060 [Arthrobacter sp. PAMC25564]